MNTHAIQQERQPCAPNHQPFSLFATQDQQFRTPPATPPQEQHKRNRGGGAVMGVTMSHQQHRYPQQQQQQCDELPAVQQNSGKRSRSNKYIAPRETDRTSFAAVMGRSLINHYQKPLELRRQLSSSQLVQFLGNDQRIIRMDEDNPPQSGRERSMSF